MEELTSKIFVEPAIDKKMVGLCEGYVHDRNLKICQDCFEKLDTDKQHEHVWMGQLHRNRLL